MALTLGELLSKVERLPFIIFPILPKGGRMIIGAPPKSYKSMLTLNMAYSLAEGDKFLKWEVDKPRTVLYFESEIGRWGLKSRLDTIHKARGGQIVTDNLILAAKGKKRYSLDEGSPGLVNVRAEIEKYKPDIVVIDPLRKFTTADEDSSTEMVKVFQSLDSLQEEYGLTVIVVHHAGKRSEWRDGGDPESLRGSSEIFADGDSYIIIEQPVKNRREVLRLNFRFRHAADIEPVLVEFDKDTDTFSLKSK